MSQEALVVGETNFHFSWWVRLFWKNLGDLTTVVHDMRKAPWWASDSGVTVVNGVSPWDDMGERVWDWIFYPNPCSPVCLTRMFPQASTGIKDEGAVGVYFDKWTSTSYWELDAVANRSSLALTEVFDDIPGLQGKLYIFRLSTGTRGERPAAHAA